MEGRGSSSSKGPIEKGSDLRRMDHHISEEDDEHMETPKRGKGKPKAKASPKAKAPKSKAKAKASPKSKAKASPKSDAKASPKNDAKASPKNEAKATEVDNDAEQGSRKRKCPTTRSVSLDEAFKTTFHAFNQARKPEPLIFNDMRADAALSNPDHIRQVLKYECMKCLIECHKAGEADKKGKHNHLEKMFAPDGYRYELYWTRSAVGVKKWGWERVQTDRVLLEAHDVHGHEPGFGEVLCLRLS